MAESAWIVNVGTEQFEELIVKKSLEVPVIVDFWAPWCQPCLKLAPLLEKIVEECAGKVILAKVNIDEAQELAMMCGVQSIPLVAMFSGGQPVDSFMGVIPEEQLRQWVMRFVPSKAQELVSQALVLEPKDQVTAEAKLRESLELEEVDETKIHLARVLFAQSRFDEAGEIIAALEARGYLEPEAESIKSQLELQATAEESGGIASARQAADANPNDLALQVRLADALAADSRHRDAFEILLAVIDKDLGGPNAKEAKEQMVKLFGILGGSALVNEYRHKLATLLY